MSKFLARILALFFVVESSSENKYSGIYRMPGDVNYVEEAIKPVEPKQTNKWLKRFREKINQMSYNDFLENTWKTLFGLLLTSILCGGIFILFKVIFANGNVDYCYIERWTYIKEVNQGLKPPEKNIASPENQIQNNIIPKKDQNLTLVFELKGHRNWREDRDIGRFDVFEDAIEASHKINCAVEAK